MNLGRKSLWPSAAWVLFMSLQLAVATPFFGVSVQGGFQVEADISATAKTVGSVLESSQQSMATFAGRLSLSTAAQNVTAGAVLQLNDIFVSRVTAFTNRIAWAAINTTDLPSEVFKKLGDAYTNAVTAMGQEATSAIASITSYSPTTGAQIDIARQAMVVILSDVNSTLVTFQRSIDTFSVPITAKAVFDKLTESQIATIVGALEALKAEMTMANGKLLDIIAVLADSDTLMSSYVSMLSQSFGNIDFSVSNVFTTLTRLSDDFKKQLRTSDSTIQTEVQAFNAKISSFQENVIAPVATIIKSITSSFSDKSSQTYIILKPNVEERLQLVINSATDAVLEAAQNLLFTVYRMLDNAMRRIPNFPSQGKSCATEFISPYVQYLSSNLAPLLSGCISSTNGQAESVLRVQLQSIDALTKDRQAYFKLWNDALAGASNATDSTTRTIIAAKLTAETSTQLLDTAQPAFASSLSMYAQLATNLDAVLNRAKLCVTLKSAELSAPLVPTAINFNTCLET